MFKEFKDFGIQNIESVFSVFRGKKVRINATNYSTPGLKFEGIVTSFAGGLGEGWIIIDDKTIVNTKYIISIEILD